MVENGYTFEEAMTKLEKIVENLDSGEMPLEEMVLKFEEGMRLSRYCQKILSDAHGKVQKLVEEDGKAKLEDFST